jgi:hypothetical protein
MKAGRIHRVIHRCLALVLGMMVIAPVAAAPRMDDADPSKRRDALIRYARRGAEAMPVLTKSLNDSDPLVRRAAVNCMSQLGDHALPGLTQALGSDDMVVRRNAALSLGPLGAEAVPLMERALKDEDPLVRQAAVVALLTVRPKSAEVLAILRGVSHDDSPIVLGMAVTAMETYLDPTWEMRLPRDGWKFRKDTDGVGEAGKWFAVDLDDSGWQDIGIELAWGGFGHKGYIGNGWYRRTIELPEAPEADAIFMRFGAVDECARIWVNGQFVGEHNVGPGGWDDPFQVDVTDAIKWGAENQVTVLAWNTAGAGGIWQPVFIVAAQQPE